MYPGQDVTAERTGRLGGGAGADCRAKENNREGTLPEQCRGARRGVLTPILGAGGRSSYARAGAPERRVGAGSSLALAAAVPGGALAFGVSAGRSGGQIRVMPARTC